MHLCVFPTFCSANWAPRLSDSACFEIVDVIFLKQSDFWNKYLPLAAQLPRTSGFFKNMSDFLKQALPLAAQLPTTSGLFKKKSDFRETLLPQAAQLHCTSGFLQEKKRYSVESSAPGSAAAPDKWLNQKSLICERKSSPGKRLVQKEV